jgi:hypothetical protein
MLMLMRALLRALAVFKNKAFRAYLVMLILVRVVLRSLAVFKNAASQATGYAAVNEGNIKVPDCV